MNPHRLIHRHHAIGISGLRVVSVAELGKMFGVIGASDLALRIAQAVDRHHELGRAATTAEDTVKAARATLSRQIGAGEIDPTKAAAELVKVEQKANLHGPAAKQLTLDAKRSVLKDQIMALRSEGDRLITGTIAPAIHAAADRLMIAANQLPDDPTPEAAITAGTADAWRTASEAVHLIETAWLLAGRLRSGGITFTLRQPSVPPICWEWLNPPSRRPSTIGEWATAIGEDRGPTALTASEVVEIHIAPPADRELNAREVHDAIVANVGAGVVVA